MSLNVNYLGKVIFKPMLVSRFPYYAGGNIHSCLLAVLRQVIFAIALLLACHLCAVFFPTLPLFFRAR